MLHEVSAMEKTTIYAFYVDTRYNINVYIRASVYYRVFCVLRWISLLAAHSLRSCSWGTMYLSRVLQAGQLQPTLRYIPTLQL